MEVVLIQPLPTLWQLLGTQQQHRNSIVPAQHHLMLLNCIQEQCILYQ